MFLTVLALAALLNKNIGREGEKREKEGEKRKMEEKKKEKDRRTTKT